MLIGDFSLPLELFKNLDDSFKQFSKKSFQEKPSKDRFTAVNQTLLQLIQQAPSDAYLLPAVLNFMDRVNSDKLLNEPYNMNLFEFWLNSYSNLSSEERYKVRSKIVGKNIPREAYQTYFPIGMQKRYPGSHFVVAHLSPDIDTTIASFWGFMDAFGAEVATAQHIWNVPGGAPDSHINVFFKGLFGPSVFTHLVRPNPTLALSAIDLVTQKGMSKEQGHVSSQTISHRDDRAVIHVDEKGHYLGDFRATDVEPVKQITTIFKSCLYWFENRFHVQFISLFSHPNGKVIEPFLKNTFDQKLQDVSHLLEFPEQQQELLKKFLKEIFKLDLDSTFGDLTDALKEFAPFKKEVEGLKESDLKTFEKLESIIKMLDTAIVATRALVERIDFLMEIKHRILGKKPEYMVLKSDVEELKTKMKNLDYLTIVIPEGDGKLHPVGIVRAVDLRKEVLGTTTFRDFSNFQETKMSSYLQVISVIDHHKIDLKTVYAPKIEISDAQSSNVLLAEKAFEINDRYGLGGQDLPSVQAQLNTETSLPIKRRLLQKQMASPAYSIHPSREYAEYLSFLHAILDDTDLLSKVTDKDVECVVSLLNRLKSLALKKETEVLSLNDIPRGEQFAKKAASKILKNDEMYSVYKKIYALKEQEMETNLLQGNIFADTKEQNGCCRVGQTKIFSSNFPTYLKQRDAIRKEWLKSAQESYKNSPEIDFHLHMISTVPSAAEVHGDAPKAFTHQDEIWLWMTDTQLGQDHLTRFLSAFQNAPEVANNKMEIQFLGENSSNFDYLFSRSFVQVPKKKEKAMSLPIAVLHFNPGSINSRKSMITPYLPRLI